MKSKLILLLMLGINIFSCSSQPLLKLEDDPTIWTIFDEVEINNLTTIINFFDSHVLSKTPNEGINDAYHTYLESLRYAESYENFKFKVGLNMSKIDSLTKLLIENKIFHEIWKYEYGSNYVTKDTITVILAPNLDGKYWKLIEIISHDNPYLNEYNLKVEECACIPPSIIIGFQNIHDKFDFNIELNRLIWAVHFITAFREGKY